MSATVSEANSMTPDFVREQLPVETRKSIIDVERRQSIVEQQLAEQPLRALVDPIARMEKTMGSTARERIIKGLEQGGRPVTDERGMTVGVVTKSGLFGGEVYTGRPEYDPIRARVEDATSGQFSMAQPAASKPRSGSAVRPMAAAQPGAMQPSLPTAPPRLPRERQRGVGQRPAASVGKKPILGQASTTATLLD